MAGIYTLTQLYVGAAHSTTVDLTETTVETFVDTATTTTTKAVAGVNGLTGIGNTRSIEVSEVLGEEGARKYLGQINVEDITFAMDYDKDDGGQALLLDGGSTPRGFAIVVRNESGTIIEYLAFNGVYFVGRDFNPNTKAVANMTIGVFGVIQEINNAT